VIAQRRQIGVLARIKVGPAHAGCIVLAGSHETGHGPGGIDNDDLPLIPAFTIRTPTPQTLAGTSTTPTLTGQEPHNAGNADPARGHPTERNASEHTADERKRHDSAPEHPAYDPDAGQRVLRSAAHRRAVRAEREACCGALRHLAHCCVAF